MTSEHKPPATCPVCSQPIEMSKEVFRADFKCGYCGVPLEVSLLYWRVLGVVSVLTGYAVA